MQRLNRLKAGTRGRLMSVDGCRSMERRLIDMGLMVGELVEVVQNTGMGPVTVLVKGSRLALGHTLAERMLIKEEGMAVGKKVRIALAGNPNAGKSSLFNALTGARQHVGNYPGVTVEKKEGQLTREGYEITVIDLPGTYSLSAASEDEAVARDYIVRERPDVVVDVVDASNLERNLYLFTEMEELGVPLVLAMNMSDMVKQKNQQIDYEELSRLLNKPLVQTVGSKGTGVDALIAMIIKVHEGKELPGRAKISYGDEIEKELCAVTDILAQDEALKETYPVRWLGLKLLENDVMAMNTVRTSKTGSEALAQAVRSRKILSDRLSEDTEVSIASRRYGFISGVCTQVVRTTVELVHDISDKIDKVVLNRVLGLPIFALVMYSIFKFTFTCSEPVVGWFEFGFEWLSGFVSTLIPEGLTRSFLVDGVIGGVGGVLGFFPLVLFMFFAIAFFEDSGYMARAAFVMDRIMQKFGLHGKSFMPLMISTNGCAVPGIMATRTLESPRDRMITMMVTPFMICGAKLPIFLLFISAFFPAKWHVNMMFLMYGLSVAIALGCAWLLKKLVFKGESAHFVMELPPYRMPSLKSLLIKMWERGWLYLQKAGSIILLLSIVVWAAFTFPQVAPPAGMGDSEVAAYQMEHSIAGQTGNIIEPWVRPIGLDGRSGIALIAGLAAKEVVVSTFGTIYALGEVDMAAPESLRERLARDPAWNPVKAMAFLMFCLIYLPCVTATAVFFRESGSSLKWLWFLIFWTTVLAWGMAFLVYQIGTFLRLGV
jgi:ferrous iron transport protein B